MSKTKAEMTARDRLMYLAGIMDGEGHFCRDLRERHGRSYLTCRMVVSTIDKELVEWLKEHFGGNWNGHQPKQVGRAYSYQWALYGAKATALSEMLQPYLIIKREQVKRIIPPYQIIPSIRKGRQPRMNDIAAISKAVNYRAVV